MIRDLHGLRVGRLVVVELHNERNSYGWRQWLCRCDCGNTKLVGHYALTSQSTRSCGCLRVEVSRVNITKAIGEWEATHLALLDTLLDCVSRRPRSPGEIRREFLDNWGSCNERTFWRALRRLRKQGRIERIGHAQSSGSTYRRAA